VTQIAAGKEGMLVSNPKLATRSIYAPYFLAFGIFKRIPRM
jgi:hypothetical protein